MRYSILKSVAVSASVVAFSSHALAADLARPAPYYAPGPVYAPPPFSWTGLYVGGNLGYGRTEGDGTVAFGGAPGTFSGEGDGFLAGVQIGYNWQLSNWVLGVETDFQGGFGDGTVSGSAGATTFTATSKVPWSGTFRGRVGYAFDRSMIYATGGVAYGKSELEGTLTPGGAFSADETYWTWTAGAGYEAMLWDRWSAKIEYLYGGTPSNAPVAPGTTSIDGDSSTHVVRVGLNYHF